MTTTATDLDPTTGLRAGTFGIATLSHEGRVFAAVVRPDGGVVDVSRTFADTHAIFDDWAVNFDVLVALEAAASPALHLDEVRVLPPLAHPNVLCAGANNKTHVAQMLTKNDVFQKDRHLGETDEDFYQRNYSNVEKRALDGVPYLFPSLHSALAGAAEDVLLPPIGRQHDWELELAAVIGRPARFASIEKARDLIAGYTIVNDIGTVDMARRTDIHFEWDWLTKSQPTFKPFGPFIVPAAFVEIDSMTLSLSVNGEVMQNWPADDMIFDFARLVAYASERVRLQPGDLVLGGSVPGNGAHHGGRFLTHDDVIDASITYLGHQRNHCVTEDLGGREPAIGPAPTA